MSSIGRRAAAVVFVMCVGCTLIAPEKRFFDSRGLEAIASVDGSVDALALAGDDLYVVSGTALLRKSVADTEPLQPVAHATVGFDHLVSDGASLVAWCDAGAWTYDPVNGARKIPDSAKCASIAAWHGTVAYVEANGSNRVRVFDARAGAIVGSAIALPISEPGPLGLAISAPGEIYATSPVGVMRVCQAADLGCENGLCRLSSANPQTSHVAVVGSGASARVLWFDGVQGVMSAPTSACCPFADKNCDADPLRQRRSAPVADAVVGDRIFVLGEGSVRVVDAFADPTRDVVISAADANARVLAMNGDRIVFTSGSQIVRAGYRVVTP